MIWIYAEDSYYYNNEEELKKILKGKVPEEKLKNKVFVFQKENLEKILNNGDFNKTIMSPYLPSHFGYETSFFGVVRVPNKFGLLTTSEKESGLTEYEKLNRETGLTIEKSPVTFDDMAGNERLKQIADQLSIKYSMGEVSKAIFLAGVPGTGKSFFAQCLAGETDRLLVSFNLAKIMYKENPIESFDNIIEYLQKQDQRYLLWIDEIEKLFTDSEKSEHIKNKFLTFLNDLGNLIKMDAFVVLTANNVSNILDNNPEMVRSGRVEPFGKVFLDFPKLPTAIAVCDLYIKKRNSEKERIKRLVKFIRSIYENVANRKIWIYQYTIEVFNWIKENYEEKVFKDENKLKGIIEENKEKEFVIKECLEKMIFPIDAETIIDYIDRNYTFVCDPEQPPQNFPYVQAEIKEIVTQLYYKHLEVNLNDSNVEKKEIYNQIMKSNMPIGEAGSFGIDKMKGNQDKFSITID